MQQTLSTGVPGRDSMPCLHRTHQTACGFKRFAGLLVVRLGVACLSGMAGLPRHLSTSAHVHAAKEGLLTLSALQSI